MDIKELVRVEGKNGCFGCVAYAEMKKAIRRTGSCEGTLCERIGTECLQGTIWVKADGVEKKIHHKDAKNAKRLSSTLELSGGTPSAEADCSQEAGNA